MKNKFLNLKVNMEFSNIQPINSQFSNAFIKVMYPEGNKNLTWMDKDMIIRKMLPTIYNIPIVGHYLGDNGIDNFGGHDSAVAVDDNMNVTVKDLCMPYGVIPESSEITWQTITEADGTKKEYLCCTGLLWTGRYPELLKLENQPMNQSMEIIVNTGYYDENDGYYHIIDAEFSGLCILGRNDKEPWNNDENVEPCFESASITLFSNQKDKFKKEFSFMLQEIKNSVNQICLTNKNGVMWNMSKKKKNEEIEIKKEIEMKKTEKEKQLSEKPTEELKDDKEKVSKEEEDLINKKKDKKDEDFENKYFPESTKIQSNPNEEEQSIDDKKKKVSENDEDQINIEELKSKNELLKEQLKQVSNELKETQAKLGESVHNFEIIKQELEDLKTKYSKLKEDYEVLEKFKTEKDKETLINKISSIISEFTFTEEEIKDIVEKAIESQISLEEFKKELFALEGMKAVQNKALFSKKENNRETTSFKIMNTYNSEQPYSSLQMYFK